MKFARVFDVTRYNQIVMMKQQNEQGEPVISFFCQPEGMGVCSFSIGWGDDKTESMVETAFEKLVMREVIEIVDGWFKHMAAMEQKH
jgi:hypothetical protein